jgi:hypothetical protein
MPSWLQLQHLWLDYGAVVPILVILGLAVWLLWKGVRALIRSWAAVTKGIQVVNIILGLPTWQQSQDEANTRKEQKLTELQTAAATHGERLEAHLAEHAAERPLVIAMRAELQYLSSQVRNNHGSSLRDAIDAIRNATPGAGTTVPPMTSPLVTIQNGVPA